MDCEKLSRTVSHDKDVTPNKDLGQYNETIRLWHERGVYTREKADDLLENIRHKARQTK